MIATQVGGLHFEIRGVRSLGRRCWLSGFGAHSTKVVDLRIEVVESVERLEAPKRLADGSFVEAIDSAAWRIHNSSAKESPLVLGLLLGASAKGSLVLHSSAIEHRGFGLLMTGPSESGKSTFATLMSDNRLLSDEFNLIEQDSTGRITVSATPLRSSCPRTPNNITAPLGAVLFPVKDSRDFLEPVAPDVALRHIAAQAVTPQIPGLKPPFKLLAEIARRVPAFNFHFRKDPACRSLLDELPLK